MAKQNFLAGGFYGKLGATVGQRWKNQRTIRTYVIPENPRTPKQMANRNKFTAAVPFAQKGMSMNYRSPAFASETTTEWALRMSSAKYAIDLGQSDVAAIPVVPRGFTSAYAVTGIAIESVTDATHAKLLLTGSLPEGAKHYSLMIYFSDGSRVGEYMLCHGETTAADNTELTITCEDTTDLLTATLYGVIVSNDDIDAQTVTYSARVAIEKAAKPAFAQTLSITNVTSDNAGGFNVTAQMGVYGADLVGVFENGGVSAQGTYCTKAAVRAAAGGTAPTSPANTLAWTVTNWSVNNTTGAITFTARPTTYQDINEYALTSFDVVLNWANAYNSETSLSSGSCNASAASTPQYTQPTLSFYSTDVTYDSVVSNNDGTFTANFTFKKQTADLVGTPSIFSAQSTKHKGKTKADVFLAGGESGAAETDLASNIFSVQSSNYNLSTGKGYVTYACSAAATVQTFNATVASSLKLAYAYDNAHRVTANPSFFMRSCTVPEHLQSAFTLGNWDVSTLESFGSIDPVFDLQGHWLGYCESEIKVTANLDATADALKALYDIYQLHLTNSASFSPLGRLYLEDEDGNDYQSSTLAGSDFTCDGEDEPTYLEVRYRYDLPQQTISVESGDVANTVATLLNENNNRFGIYDASHIWTALPTVQFSGNLEF